MLPETKHSRVCPDPDCPVCASWRAEKRVAGLARVLARRRGRTASQRSLTDYAG